MIFSNFEIYTEIRGFPEYKISNFGNVVSTRVHKSKGKIMKYTLDKTTRYLRVSLYKPGSRKVYSNNIHRLVAEHFIPNPNNLRQVDHIDHDRKNNFIGNLRWVSSRDNNRNRSLCVRNTSGTQGVRRYINYSGNEYWRAEWYDEDKKQRCKSFNIKKYGETEAKRLAIVYRKEKVDLLYNRV